MRLRQSKYTVGLIIINCLAYIQLVLGIYPTKWDNLSAFFPYRYTASHWIHNGHLPLWDFYQNFGYPMHANPQGATWYPITWIVSAFGTYTPYLMNLEVIFHIIVGSIGLFHLGKMMLKSTFPAFIIALGYSMSGFVLGTSHMIGFTIAACWLPWCLWAFFRILHSTSWRNIVALTLFTSLQIVGGYTAFTIILVYIYAGLFIYHHFFIQKIVGQHLISFGVALISVIALCSPYLYSVFDSLAYYARGSGLQYNPDDFKSNLDFAGFQTFFTPFVARATPGIRNVDVSLTNLYIGVSLLTFAFYGFIKSKPNHRWFLLLLIILFYLLALGNHTPVHKWAFLYLPGISYFRHPYLFSLYSTFILLLFSGIGLNHILIHRVKPERNHIVLLSGILIVVLVYLGVRTNWDQFSEFWSTFTAYREKTTFNNFGHAFIQACIFVILCISIYVSIRNQKTWIFGSLIILELLIAVQLNAPLTLVYNEPLQNINDHLSKISNSSLTNQEITTDINQVASNIPASVGLWVNLNTYTRTTGTTGYNPFVFDEFLAFRKSTKFGNELSKGFAFYNYPIKTRTESLLDSLHLGFNEISFFSSIDGLITINHNYHHNWTATGSGNPLIIEKDKYGRMQLEIPKGKIHLHYRNSMLSKLVYVSAIGWIIIFLLAGFHFYVIYRNLV